MTHITAIHEIDPVKLSSVKAEMAELGSPTIRAVETADGWMALEGVHRLAAAAEAGTAIVISPVTADTIDLDTLDWDDNGWFDDRSAAPVAEVLERMFREPIGASYRVNGDMTLEAV